MEEVITIFGLPLGLFLGAVGSAASMIGLGVSTWTLLRVRTIGEAREKERELVAKALRLPELQDNLLTAEALLKSPLPEASERARHQLVTIRAGLDSALRILIPNQFDSELLSGVEVVRENYWCDEFATAVISKAQQELTIVTWRNTRCFSESKIQSYVDALLQNPELKIKIFYVSPDAPDYVYETMEKMLTIGNADEMREQQKNQAKFALGSLKSYAKTKGLTNEKIKNIEFFEYDIVPNLHCVVVDDQVNWGINFYMEPSIGATSQLSTSYLRSKSDTAFGQKIQEQIHVLRQLSLPVLIELEGGDAVVKETPKLADQSVSNDMIAGSAIDDCPVKEESRKD